MASSSAWHTPGSDALNNWTRSSLCKTMLTFLLIHKTQRWFHLLQRAVCVWYTQSVEDKRNIRRRTAGGTSCWNSRVYKHIFPRNQLWSPVYSQLFRRGCYRLAITFAFISQLKSNKTIISIVRVTDYRQKNDEKTNILRENFSLSYIRKLSCILC